MKNHFKLLAWVLVAFGCAQNEPLKTITVTNELPFARSGEVVSVSVASLGLAERQSVEGLVIADSAGNPVLTQWVDENKDGVVESVLFQPDVAGNASVTYILRELKKGEIPMKGKMYCYSRFVPERTDDYAWENDKVAFRTYGPKAQQMVEEGVKGGTLTSGIDCWLKRVEYPVIDKWYKKYTEKTGSYHRDSGEGLDNFHVGDSRGCGGIAIRDSGEYKTSKNFTSYNTLTTGALRTAFVLDYAPWEVREGQTVETMQNISLDKGSQLSRFEVSVNGSDMISAGLTLHENDGEVKVDSLSGWLTYWQPHGDSRLATAILAKPGTFLGYDKVETDEKDLSNVYVDLAVEDGKAVYYTGFFWEKSGQFASIEDWYAYLDVYAEKIATPLAVSTN